MSLIEEVKAMFPDYPVTLSCYDVSTGIGVAHVTFNRDDTHNLVVVYNGRSGDKFEVSILSNSYLVEASGESLKDAMVGLRARLRETRASMDLYLTYLES